MAEKFRKLTPQQLKMIEAVDFHNDDNNRKAILDMDKLLRSGASPLFKMPNGDHFVEYVAKCGRPIVLMMVFNYGASYRDIPLYEKASISGRRSSEQVIFHRRGHGSCSWEEFEQKAVAQLKEVGWHDAARALERTIRYRKL